MRNTLFQFLARVVELLHLVGPSLGMHRGGGWAVSLSPCRRKACTRSGNKVSGQSFCTSAPIVLPHLRSARHRFFTTATLATSSRLWVHVASNFIVFFYLLLGLTRILCLIAYEICLKLKSANRIMRIFPTIQKPYCYIYSILTIAGASDAMKPERFTSGETFVDGGLRSSFG